MLSQRLRSARKYRGLTQEELAIKVKTTKATISNYENGHSSPHNEMLTFLADVLNVSTDYLLGRTDDPNTSDNKDIHRTEFENLFFNELDKLSEEDKKKALEHVKYLRFLAEQENKK